MSRDRRRHRRPVPPDEATSGRDDTPAGGVEAWADSDTARHDATSAQIYENELERAWAEAPPSMQGIAPELMRARRGAGEQAPPAEPAALHPWLMVFGALMGGPVVAGVLALFSDGRAPKARDLVAILALSAAGWLGMQGIFAFGPERFGPRTVVLAGQGVLVTQGVLLLLLYLGPMQGRRGSDPHTLRQSLVVVIGLTALYWLGRDAAWLEWLGR
ncbi:hypothetical protein EA187_01130 [Lujinxingia sediminis]|uniref:Uncharacterized protein n=1 Tax=Lujinxingia sediminis TaxID=2480984 RepID=A0ABY0CWS7_9DELT|nr:hypothetical protein [Lujinxingia sediminis]RVU48070.1 hypothetical protein EA187_01130 [Lujinxingia sediminis]